jgi:hypothetical protein
MCWTCKAINKKYFLSPQKGDLRIWHIPQVPGDQFYYPVSSLEEAAKILEAISFYDLFQFNHKIKPDFCNANGLQVFNGKDWEDWTNEDGDYFDEIKDKFLQKKGECL